MPNTQINKLMASVNVDWKQTLPDETSPNLSPVDASTFGALAKVTQGTSFGQADMILRDVHTLAPSGNLNVLPDNANDNALGESLTMAKINLVWVRSRAAHISGGDPRMTISGTFMERISGAAGATFDVHPGGYFCFYHPQGITLVANDTLTFTNTSATDPIEFEYLLAGTD